MTDVGGGRVARDASGQGRAQVRIAEQRQQVAPGPLQRGGDRWAVARAHATGLAFARVGIVGQRGVLGVMARDRGRTLAQRALGHRQVQPRGAGQRHPWQVVEKPGHIIEVYNSKGKKLRELNSIMSLKLDNLFKIKNIDTGSYVESSAYKELRVTNLFKVVSVPYLNENNIPTVKYKYSFL